MILLSLFAASLASASAETRISVAANPPLPVENLAKNPGFEDGAAMPDDWKFAERSAYFYSSREPWRTTIARKAKGGIGGGAYLKQDVHTTSVLSELFMRQLIPVQPATLYRMGVFARLRSGQAYVHVLHEDMYAYAAKSEMKVSWGGSPLSPQFVHFEMTRSPRPDEWVWVGTEFRSKKDEHFLSFGIGSYYERGSMDFDDVFFGLARTELEVKVTGEDLKEVTVADESGRIRWQSGPLPAGTAELNRRIPDLSTAERYEVTAVTANNQRVSKWYPEK